MTRSDAYTEDGGKTWRWKTNGSYCPLDACEKYGIPCHEGAQQAARDKQNAEFVAAYKARGGDKVTRELRAGAWAAHGPGVTIVNVVTGRTFTT